MAKRNNIPSTDEWLPGEDTEHRITVVDKQGVTVVLTGMLLTYSMRATRNGATLSGFTEKTVGAGITLESSAGNTDDIVVIDIDAADTSGLDQSVWYNLRRTDSDEVQVVAEGTIPFEDVGL